jgi:hypothetical protein
VNHLLRIENVLNELAACLCVGFDDPDQTPPCFCGVVPGDAAINDFLADCEDRDGMAYVRLASVYPAETTGEVSQQVRNLRLGIGFDIEVGIQRTLVVDSDGTSTPQQQAEMVHQEMLDLATIFKAFGCCVALKEIDVIAGQWTPVGPQGFVYGGTITLFCFLP